MLPTKCVGTSYLIYVCMCTCKEDLALNNLQGLICHNTQPNKIIYLIYMYKEDLELNNQHGLICHRTQANNNNCYTDTFKD